MADTAPKKKAASKSPKAPAAHPTYKEMIVTAIKALKERGGSSRQAILKYILANFKVVGDEKAVNSHLKLALRRGVEKNTLKQSKGVGASGSFRVGDLPKAEKKPKKKAPAKAKKPKAKKAATPKKAGAKAKKPKAKKAAKSPAKKAASKPKSKSPAKKKAAASKAKKPAAKKAATKSPKKKAAAKAKKATAKK